MRLAALLLLALTACAPVPLAAPCCPPLSERARIVWVGERPSAADRRAILDQLDRAELAHRARFGGGPIPVREVELWNAATLPREWLPLRSGQSLMGAAWPAAGKIALPHRGRLPLGRAVHELHHLATGRTDHDGGHWRAVEAHDLALARESWGLAGWR